MYAEYSPNMKTSLTNGTDKQLLAVIFDLVLRNTFNCGKGVGQDK